MNHGSRMLAASVLIALLAGCAGPQAPPSISGPLPEQAAGPRRLVTVIKGDPPTLSDKINSSGAGGVPGVSEVERLITAGLTIRDAQGISRAQLAEAVPTVENGRWRVGPDGRMDITWTVNPNARWHDGTEFTSDDLVFTARVVRDRELPHFRDASFEFLDTVEAPDRRTIVARWKSPYIDADTLFSHARALPLPRHLLETTYTENKAAFIEQPFWTQGFIGTGPYRVQEWVAGSHLILAANDQYLLGRPRIDQIEVKFITDPNTLVANILAGVVDLTLGRGLDPEQAEAIIAQRKDVRLELAVAGCLCAFPQYLNPNPSVIADARLRRALSHAVDRKALADSLQNGLVPASHVWIGPNQPEYPDIQSSVVRYEYDVRRAQQLLEELGFSRGSDGGYRDSSGQRLNVEMRTTPNEELGKKLLFAAADYWQQAGVAVDSIVIPPQQATDREWRANFPGFDMVNQPSNLGLLQRFHGKEASLPENDYRGNNRMRYRVPELDALIDRYFVTIPWGERMNVAGQAVRHITEGVVAISLLYNAQPVIMNARLENVASTAVGWNAHEWTLR